MIPRTTFKALWVGGGGLLATWLAVTPNNGVVTSSPAQGIRRAASPIGPAAQELNAQATRLRERSTALTLRPSTRNPFRFRSAKPAEHLAASPERPLPAASEQAISVAPARPLLKLSGVAQKAGKRTAIISGEGQLYLVAEGESVAGRYVVVRIDSEAVLLRDTDGAEQRLILPQ